MWPDPRPSVGFRGNRLMHFGYGNVAQRGTEQGGTAVSQSGSAPLAGRTLFITGASGGIGLAIALRAAADGATIAIAAKTTQPHPKLPGTIYTAAAEIEAAGGRALPLAVDIRDDEQVAQAVARTVETFGGIDILVNKASATTPTLTPATHMKRFDLMQQINPPA